MRISKTKKILIVALSLILLFSISCGDRPTGSTTDGVSGTIPSEHNGRTYRQDTTASPSDSGNIYWLQIKDEEIYREETGENDSKPTEFTTKFRDLMPNVKITIEGNIYTYTFEISKTTFEFTENWEAVEMKDTPIDGSASPTITKFKIHKE